MLALLAANTMNCSCSCLGSGCVGRLSKDRVVYVRSVLINGSMGWGCTSHTFIQEDQAIDGANRSIKNYFCVCPKLFATKTAIMGYTIFREICKR